MKPRLKRGEFVRGMSTLYTSDHTPIPKGRVGVVENISAHGWVAVRGIFVITVRFFDGLVARVNERALVRMRPGPSKHDPFEDDEG